MTKSNQFTQAAVFITTALTPLAIVLAITVGQAAQANDYDHRPTTNSANIQSGACSIGYGCK